MNQTAKQPDVFSADEINSVTLHILQSKVDAGDCVIMSEGGYLGTTIYGVQLGEEMWLCWYKTGVFAAHLYE